MKVDWRDWEDWPEEHEFIWAYSKHGIFPISRYGVWVDDIAKWAPIEFPDPPEKELHRCNSNEFPHRKCIEKEGKLWLIYLYHGEYHVVKFCEFCGFTLEEG